MTIVSVAAFVAALGCALTAGLLFAFSVSIMRGLRRLPAAQGITAMNAFNDAILNPVFGLVFFVASATSLGLAVSAPFTWHQSGAPWRLVGGLLFFVGVFVVTMGVNIPLNDSLAAVDPDSAEGATFWQHYQAMWTGWNHLRTVAGTGAVASLIRALL
jgi:uncharacterized membrane protein